MKEYHVVFEGKNGFQKEESLNFTEDLPPVTYLIREYQQLFPLPLPKYADIPSCERLTIKERIFRKIASFYCCGRDIVYYRED